MPLTVPSTRVGPPPLKLVKRELCDRRRIDYRRDLARLYADMGSARVVSSNPVEAAVWYKKSLDLWKELQDEHALWAKEIDMPREIAEDLSGLHLPQPR